MEQVQIVTVNSNHLGGDLKSTDSVVSSVGNYSSSIDFTLIFFKASTISVL